MRAVFMGTPDFAVPSLKALIESDWEVVGVVTQPDKPKGRGKKMSFPPVKEEALKHGIQVHQPQKVKDSAFVKVLRDLKPDLIVVVAFGQILSKEILDIPKFGCINVHASLLPKYRGAAPLNWVIINGEKTTGITTMYMSEGLDTGDMILKKEIKIGEYETAGQLHDRMCVLGGEVLKETLKLIQENKAPREVQDNALSCYAPIMDKELGNIKWNKSAKEIVNLIRGTNPWPGTFTKYNGETVKIWRAKVLEDEKKEDIPGQIIKVSKEGIQVVTGCGILLVEEIQMSGKKRMDVKEYIKGNEIDEKVVLGV